MELFEGSENEEDYKVTCLTTYGEDVWGGCQSGFVFCYRDEEKKEKGEEKESDQEGGEEKMILCHSTQLLGEGGVSAIVGEKEGKEGLVWVGGKNGSLSVWKRGHGLVVGEELKFSASLLENYRFGFRKMFSWREIDFKLEYGEVKWRGLNEEGRLLMKDVKEVREVGFDFYLFIYLFLKNLLKKNKRCGLGPLERTISLWL